MQERPDAVAEPMHGQTHTRLDPDEVSGDWVAEGPELVQVASAAERAPVAAQAHLGDGGVSRHEIQCFEENVPGGSVEGVVALWPVERNLEDRRLRGAAKHQAVSLRLPEGVDPSVLAPTPLQPRPELGPGL